jgi:hypothetical protein
MTYTFILVISGNNKIIYATVARARKALPVPALVKLK